MPILLGSGERKEEEGVIVKSPYMLAYRGIGKGWERYGLEGVAA